jgi:hypothetical protein
LPAALAIVAAAFVIGRHERSLVGELVACAALVTAAVPTAIAGAIPGRDAFALAGVFVAAFVVSTVEVRSIANRPASPLARVACWLVAIAIAIGVAPTRPLLALAPLPIVAVVAYFALRAPSAKELRRLGWTLATSTLLTAVTAVVALRVASP